MKTELQLAADKLVREIFAVKPGEIVTITTDYDSNMNLIRSERRRISIRRTSLQLS